MTGLLKSNGFAGWLVLIGVALLAGASAGKAASAGAERSGGQVWVAEAGQSDFSADWLQRVYALDLPVDVKARVHVVQHSDWNESVRSCARSFGPSRERPICPACGRRTRSAVQKSSPE